MVVPSVNDLTVENSSLANLGLGIEGVMGSYRSMLRSISILGTGRVKLVNGSGMR